MKINKLLICLLIITLLFVTGCGEEEIINDENSGGIFKGASAVSSDFNYNGSGTLVCTQAAVAEGDMEVDINYTISYTDGIINKLTSVQKVSSSSNSSLSIYEGAYKNIASNYKNLDGYTTEVTRDSGSVSYVSVIDYDKIDVDEIIAIEGAEDNIFDNGKASLKLWLDLAGSVGTTCEEA